MEFLNRCMCIVFCREVRRYVCFQTGTDPFSEEWGRRDRVRKSGRVPVGIKGPGACETARRSRSCSDLRQQRCRWHLLAHRKICGQNRCPSLRPTSVTALISETLSDLLSCTSASARFSVVGDLVQFYIVVSGKLCPKRFRCYAILRVGSLMEEESCMLSVISGKIILVPITR
jgi:hypothetical protein